MDRDKRIGEIVDGLSSLIRHHAGLMASEQYAPSRTPDESDAYIQEHEKWVKELRDIRERFENLVTGML